jgi:hypothetical protein
VSLFTILGTDDPAVVGAFLRTNYVDNPNETRRRAHAQLLDEFFKGGGDAEMERVIDLLWTDPKNADRRKAVLKAGLDKYDNVIARIAQEKATVYNEPAQRVVANETNAAYQAFLQVLPQDEIMRALDEMLAIHEDALLWYRVRVKPTGEREPVLEVVSPARFWAVAHPQDQTLLVAVIIDIRAPMAKAEDPTYRVWSDDQTFVMNGKCEIMGTPEEWPLNQMPGVLCSTRPPGAKPTLLAECPSVDLLSAQKQVRLQDLSLTKESVSATKNTVFSGDMSAATMGQTSDTDADLILPEGVTAQSVDRGIDTEQFRDNATHAADAAGANHGVPPTVRSQKDASSGAEIELRMLPIRKLREKRIPIFRRIEARIARIMAMVNGTHVVADENGEPMLAEGDLQSFAFDAEGFSIDFGEVQQIMTEAEKDSTYETRKRLQLTDPIAEEMRRNPDLRTPEDAQAVIEERIQRNTWFVTQQKELMAASGALGAAQPKTPFEANRGEDEETEDADADLKALAKEVLDAVN